MIYNNEWLQRNLNGLGYDCGEVDRNDTGQKLLTQ